MLLSPRTRALAEHLRSAFLVAVVVGSGIAAERLSPGGAGLQLLENGAATAWAGRADPRARLGVGPTSPPVVSLVDSAVGGLAWGYLPAHVGAQVAAVSRPVARLGGG